MQVGRDSPAIWSCIKPFRIFERVSCSQDCCVVHVSFLGLVSVHYPHSASLQDLGPAVLPATPDQFRCLMHTSSYVLQAGLAKVYACTAKPRSCVHLLPSFLQPLSLAGMCSACSTKCEGLLQPSSPPRRCQRTCASSTCCGHSNGQRLHWPGAGPRCSAKWADRCTSWAQVGADFLGWEEVKEH